MAYQPKSYKKFVATAATATLVATAIVPVASAADAKSFKDVSSTYKVAVDYLVANDITQGMTETTFGTTKSITRGDAAIMIAKALKLNTTSAANAGFKDVNKRVAGAVNAVVAAGIASGTSKTTFNPDANITRQEMAKMIANAYNLKAGTTKNEFKDVNNNWDAYVDALLANGITLGKTATTFAATASVTRGEFALFVYRSETLAPAVVVEKVTVVNETTTTATVKVANKDLKVSDFKVLVNGVAVTPTKVESDAKGEVYTITHASLKDTKGIVSVNGSQANFDYTAPVVESVKAINAKQIQVTFNTAMDASTALNKANYMIQTNADANPIALGTKDATAQLELSEDGKTVTITTTTEINDAFKTGAVAIVAGTPFKFTVDGVKAKNGTAVEKKMTTLSSNDEIAPALVTASAKAKVSTNKVTLTFSEPVNPTGAIAYVGGIAASVVAGPTPNTIVLTSTQSLNANTEYDLTLLNFKDFAGNFLASNPTNTKFTVVSDAVAPVAQSLAVVRDNLVEVTFDKAMDASTFTSNSRILDANGVAQGGSLTATVKPGTGGKTVRLATTTAVPFNAAGTFTGTVVLGDGIKDVSGNAKAASSHAFTFTKDTVKPVLASASYVKAGAQYAGVTQTNGAIVVKFSEEVTAANTPANFKLISSAGVEVTSPAISAVAVNGQNATEVILTMAAALPVDTYTVRVANEAVVDVSTQLNKNIAAVTNLKVDGSSDAVKPVVAYTSSAPATSQTTGSSVTLGMTDNVGLDLATVQNVSNYLLNGMPLPAGTFVTLTHNGSSTSSAATDITVKLNIPEKSISKTSTYTLNVNNIKDKAGNTAAPIASTTGSLVDDVSPELKTAAISANGLLGLSFSEAVTGYAAGALNDLQFTVNGTVVPVLQTPNMATIADGAVGGTDEGKYIVTFKAVVDNGADANAGTTADNRLFLDLDNSGAYNAGDILLQTGTTATPGAVTVLDANVFSSLKVSTVAATTIKDTSSIANPIKVGSSAVAK